jgi:hypothetical protein
MDETITRQMKLFMKNKLFTIITITVALMMVASIQSYSQPAFPAGKYIITADIPTLPNEPEAPIDGGLSILLAAGIGLGVKKIYRTQKKHGPQQKE